MALFIFKYALPALLGYTLFVGIAGKFNPLRKPEHLEERPSWMLGLWTGVSVYVVLAIGLQMAYGMTLEAGRALALPSLLGVSLLLGIGFFAYSRYRKQIFAILDEAQFSQNSQNDSQIDWAEKVHQLDPIIIDRPKVLPRATKSDALETLQQELKKEQELRQETERHLRITRKALSNVGEPNQAAESSPLDPMNESIHNQQIFRPTDNIESLSSLENTRHIELEVNTAQLKRELVKAKQEIRLHIAARAKALSTANKSVAFARQSIELRARLENELESAHAALANRQSSISSLIAKLERERRLSDDELAALAKYVAVNDTNAKPADSKQAASGIGKQHGTRNTSGS